MHKKRFFHAIIFAALFLIWRAPLHAAEIHAAAAQGYAESVQALIKKGANPSQPDKNGNTPLHYAARYNPNFDVVSVLLRNGATVNVRNELQRTPLHEASQWNPNAEVTLDLLEYGADTSLLDLSGQSPLHMAARNYDHAVLYLLLLDWADVDTRDKFGNTPLHVAAWYNENPRILDLLVNKGKATVNIYNDRERTPLHLAARFSANPEIIMRLLKLGADKTIRDSYKQTAYDIIVQNDVMDEGDKQRLRRILKP